MIRANKAVTGGVDPIYRGACTEAVYANQALTAIIPNAGVSSSNTGTTITGITGSHRVLVYFTNPNNNNATDITMTVNGVQIMSESIAGNGSNQYHKVGYTVDQNITFTGNDTVTFTASSGTGNGTVMLFDIY